MNEVIKQLSIIQAIISTGAGFLGVGIGIGVFKGTIKQVKIDLARVIKKQARLRGEDNGGRPVFMTTNGCVDFRSSCVVDSHSRSIKALENYARWEMQNKGLKIEEINHILMG